MRLLRQSPAVRAELLHQTEGKRGRPAEEKMADEYDEIPVASACGSGGGCREMQLGNADLGDKGDEGKEPSSLEPRVWEPRWVGVER
jgi:hypothetical protein